LININQFVTHIGCKKSVETSGGCLTCIVLISR